MLVDLSYQGVTALQKESQLLLTTSFSFIQPIAQKQASYLKDTTDFLNFIENTKLPKSTILVSMDVTSLYTNIPQEEGITTVCEAYKEFSQEHPPIPNRNLREMPSLILQENSFQFSETEYLQTHGTAMGTKMAVAFTNIFMAKIEKELLRQQDKNNFLEKIHR